MKKSVSKIVLILMTVSSFVYGQSEHEELPKVFFGDWVETLSQCEVSSLLSISIEDDKLVVNGYEWYSDEVKVKNNEEYYTLNIKGFSEGEEFEFEINIKMRDDGKLIIIDSESEETSLVRCGE
jgi:hypothetical protein